MSFLFQAAKGEKKQRRRRFGAVLLLLLLAGCAMRSGDARQDPAAGSAGEADAETASEDAVSAAVERLLAEMDREEKAWQMLIVSPQQVTGAASTGNSTLWASGFAARGAGGVVFDGENMTSEAELRGMLAAARMTGKLAPLLCVDEEGGTVARLAYNLGAVTKFKPMFTYRDMGAETAYANARTIGSEVADFGFNVDFAPVADVWTNPDNTVIGRRAYSDDPEEAAELVSAAVRGFHDGGVGCVLKHFPGHGDTAEDSHLGAAYCARTAEELARCELMPFIAGIEAGADMVMIGHITLPALDPDHPATLSRAVVTGLLREQLGFDGVVLTDAMGMGALAGAAESEARAAVLAVEAGCDLILGAEDPDAVVRALLDGVDEARLDESVRRILRLKLDRGIIRPPEALY